MRYNSLQAIGDKVFIVHEKDNTVTVYDNQSNAITGTSTISNVTDFTIGSGDDTGFYIATKNTGGSVTVNLHKVTTAGIQTSVALTTNTMQPKSLAMQGSNIYVAGIVTGKAIVNKVSGTTSTDITGTSLPTTGVTNIKLITVQDTLYAVINGAENKIYKFDNTATKWTDVTGTATILADTKSVVTDGEFIYITSGVQNTFKASAYKFDSKGNAVKVGGDYGIPYLLNVTPGATVLSDRELSIVSATKEFVFNGEYLYLRQGYYKLVDDVFTMPK